MPTKFGSFISGKFFSKLFLILYIMFMFFSAYETDRALSLLVSTALYGAVYVVFAICAVLIITKKSVVAKWNNGLYKKIVSFLSCFFIYYLLVLILWVLICLLCPVPDKAKAVGVTVCALLSALIVLFGYLYTKVIRIRHYDIDFNRAKDAFRSYNIVMISDIHMGIFVREKHIAKIVQKINTLLPDVVVISGDIFDVDRAILNDSAELERISRQFCKINAREGIYAVAGNHDPEISDERFAKFLSDAKINLLDNDIKELSSVVLVGRTDKTNNARKEYSQIVTQKPRYKHIVVLDHNPLGIDDAVNNGASLVLCGHTHKGQMFPVSLFTKWANGKSRFYGHKKYPHAHSIITSGVGFFELPVRIGTSNEIVDIHLQL